MNGYKDTAKLALDCDNQIRILKEQREEQERIDREHREAEQRRINEQNQRRINWAKKNLCCLCGGKMHHRHGECVKKCKSCGWEVRSYDDNGKYYKF
jgi:hypothetical protein